MKQRSIVRISSTPPLGTRTYLSKRFKKERKLFNTPMHVYHSPPITLVSCFGLINKYIKFKIFLIPPYDILGIIRREYNIRTLI